METGKLKEKLNEIEMPKEMQERIMKNCNMKMEEKKMRKINNRKPMVAAASFLVCLVLTGVTALAASGKIGGFFKDIVRWDGAVTGTTYEQATDEVELRIIEVADELTIELTLLQPNVAPYSFIDVIGIGEYKVLDTNGKTVLKGEETDSAAIAEGKVMVHIPLEHISGGKYKLVVTELISSAKADQPLVMSGNWECDFVK